MKPDLRIHIVKVESLGWQQSRGLVGNGWRGEMKVSIGEHVSTGKASNFEPALHGQVLADEPTGGGVVLKGELSCEVLPEGYLPLVRRVCERFRSCGEPLEELIQVGLIGLTKVIDQYDPSRSGNFTAFAVRAIVGEIQKYFRDQGWAAKVPKKWEGQKLAVERELGTLVQMLGRAPTIPEIAEATGLSQEEVLETF